MRDDNRPKPARPRARRVLLALALGLGGALLASALLLGWVLRTASGTAWLLAHAPGVQAEQVEGALLDDFSVRRLRLSLAGLDQPLELRGLRWQDPTLAYASPPGQWLVLRIGKLQVDRVLIGQASAASPDKGAPESLWLPLELDLPQMHVAELLVAALGDKPLRDLDAALHLGAARGDSHLLSLRGLKWDRLQLSGKATQASRGKLELKAQIDIEGEDWQGQVRISGPLAQLEAQAKLDTRGQSLRADATLKPFAPWPLAALQASTVGLNLAALRSDWPQTAFSGRAEVEAHAWDQPAALRVQMSNAVAGRWDQRRLPLVSIDLDLEATPSQAQSLSVRSLDVQFGEPGKRAGRIRGQGGGRLEDWHLTATVSDLQTDMLDLRLTPLHLNGQFEFAGRGALQTPRIDVQGQLLGRWLDKPGSAPDAGTRLTLDASYTPQRIELRQLDLSAGPASAKVQAQLTREADAAWRVQTQAQLADFDARAWWTGLPGSAWLRSRQRLNASFDADVLTRPKSVWPQGRAQLTLSNSLLMGVALSGQAQMNAGSDPAAGPALNAHLALDGNTLDLDLSPGPKQLQRLSAQLKAPALDKLAPLLAMLPARPGQAAAPTLAGQLEGEIRAEGHWPALTLELALKGRDLQSNWTGQVMRLGRAELNTRLGTRASDALTLRLDAQDLGLPAARIARLRAEGQGDWRQHQLTLEMDSGLKAPAWLHALLAGGPSGNALATGTSRASLKLQGGMSMAPTEFLAKSDAMEWRGGLQHLDLRGLDPVSKGGPGKPPAWLSTSDVGLRLQWARDGRLLQASADAGRAELAGAGLRWTTMSWRAPRLAADSEQLDLKVELEPLAVAPLLARLQPTFGWSGDLLMGGHAHVHIGAAVDLDVELMRTEGDLIVTDDSGRQKLGLSDLRLALLAQQGVWHFTQGIAGTTLGVLGGAITSRTSPQARWPAADAPLEGVMEAQVSNLGTWGGWVPAGWRLGGSMRAGISLGGRIGAPEINGQASGANLSVRNLLQGVDVREGEFSVGLNGPTASIQHFTAKAGAGSLQLSGSADFGASPQAQLDLKASKFTLLGRVDRRIVTSGEAHLALTANAIKLGGKFNVDEGLIDFTRADAPTLDDDVLVLRPEQAAPESVANQPRRERLIEVDLGVDLGSKLALRGRGLDTRLGGQLRLSHQGGKPVLQGNVRTERGTYAAYGQKLEIERGELSFTGAVDNPHLDVVATRPNTDMRVGVAVSGTARSPRVRLFSEPEMSDTDKLSWLILGRGPDGLGRTDTALLQRAALALLAGEGEGVTGKLVQNLGLDEFSIAQTEGDARDTVVRLGKQLSRHWYVGYERGLNATAGNWQLIYRLAQRFTLRAQSGLDNSLDLIWQWKWD